MSVDEMLAPDASYGYCYCGCRADDKRNRISFIAKASV
jgi:hypothetical protein